MCRVTAKKIIFVSEMVSVKITFFAVKGIR